MARKRKPKRGRWNLPPFSIAEILRWADAYYQRHGQWPHCNDTRRIPGTKHETWSKVDWALRFGFRGLTPGSSLTQLLQEHRGIRNQSALPPLTPAQIVAWAEAHHRRTGKWPRAGMGAIEEAPEETWNGVHKALANGYRGLPGGSTLALFLAEHFENKRHPLHLPQLSVEQILQWADEHHAQAGQWPNSSSEPLTLPQEESWTNVATALCQGRRGLPGKSTLAQILAKHRGVRNPRDLPRLTQAKILRWAKAHHARTGHWPQIISGPIVDAPGETWVAVNASLRRGQRGLPGGDTLARLLKRTVKRKNK